jgi:hypothetical protein
MVEDILSLSDEEILAEVIEDGEDPAEIAARMRRIFERQAGITRMRRRINLIRPITIGVAWHFEGLNMLYGGRWTTWYDPGDVRPSWL